VNENRNELDRGRAPFPFTGANDLSGKKIWGTGADQRKTSGIIKDWKEPTFNTFEDIPND